MLAADMQDLFAARVVKVAGTSVAQAVSAVRAGVIQDFAFDFRHISWERPVTTIDQPTG